MPWAAAAMMGPREQGQVALQVHAVDPGLQAWLLKFHADDDWLHPVLHTTSG